MATDVVDLAKEGVPSLLTPDDIDKLDCSELYTSLEKTTKLVEEFIELRDDIFHQKEEKIQQYQKEKLLKLEKQEQEYISKTKTMEGKLSDCKKQLKEMEYKFFDLKKKLNVEEELNQNLKDEISNLKAEKDGIKGRYERTNSLYMKVIQWYEDYLNVYIDTNKENSEVITFYFGNYKKYHGTIPYIKFKITDDFKFKILETHAELEYEKENFQELYSRHDVVSFIYKSQEALKKQK